MSFLTKCWTALAILLLSVAIGTKAQSFEVDGIWYYEYVTGEVKVIANPDGNAEYKGDIVIPSSIEYAGARFTVSCIGDEAFADCDLNSIKIPASVREIGNFLTAVVRNAGQNP